MWGDATKFHFYHAWQNEKVQILTSTLNYVNHFLLAVAGSVMPHCSPIMTFDSFLVWPYSTQLYVENATVRFCKRRKSGASASSRVHFRVVPTAGIAQQQWPYGAAKENKEPRTIFEEGNEVSAKPGRRRTYLASVDSWMLRAAGDLCVCASVSLCRQHTK